MPVSADYNVAVSKVDKAMNTSDLGTTTDGEESAMLLKSKGLPCLAPTSAPSVLFRICYESFI